ncbi:MAG: restriction endonuclease subunit S [Prevotella sp.]|nr:restriction endonuclease subunit S [Prevotella sp.]
MEEWIRCNIGDVCNTISDTYRGDADEVVLVNTSDVLEGKCLNHQKSPNKNLKGQFKKTFQRDDILYSEIRPANKRFAYIDFDGTDYIASTKLMVIRHNAKILSQFLYYIITSQAIIEELQMLAESRSGTFPQITFSELACLSIKLPPLSEQAKIIALLKSLDDKIEVNRQINDNLEQQAQALFKSWFVDFEPFKNGEFVESELGMIPKGWRVVSLADLMDYSGGSQPPASEFIDEEREGYIRFIQIRDYASDSHVTYIPISKKNKLCDVRDIMIARYGASLGRICYGLKGAYNVALAKVYPTKNHYLEILRCYLNTREFYEGINQKGNRAVQAGFNKSDIQSFLLPIPNNEEIIVKFNELCSSMFDSRLTNDIESRRLAELRDTLLPRLMSGELRVTDMDLVNKLMENNIF